MKIAFVISTLDFGGAQTMLLRLLKNLSQEKHQIKVFVRESRKNNYIESEIEKAGVPIEFLQIGESRITRKTFLYHKIKSYFVFAKELRKFNPEIIHTHLELFYSLCYALLHKTRIVITIHSQPYRIVTKQLKVLLLLLAKRKILKVVGCAQCITHECEQTFWIKKDFYKTIYNPIELSLYYTSPKMSNDFYYVHVGRLEKIKNQTLLITAFSKVLTVCPNSKLLLVGDGPLYGQLNELCETLKIKESVVFLGNRKDVPEILSKADVFVMSSDSEACPMSILEAMASSLPIISTDVGGVKELSADCGIFTPKGEELDLSNAMIEMQKNNELRRRMKMSSYDRSRSFDSCMIATEYNDVYNEMMDVH